MNSRGYGDRRSTEGPYTMEQISHDVQRLADQLGWHAFALVGHSMGGNAMQHVMADVPERVQCAVGIAPVAASGIPFDDRSWTLYSDAASEPKARRIVINALTGKRQSDEWLDDMVSESMEQTRAAPMIDYLQSWARNDFSDRVKELPTPVLVIVGRHDPAIREDHVQETWLQYYPNAGVSIIEEASHFPMFETPKELAELMEGFLLRHTPR